jgi:hypothetical protein
MEARTGSVEHGRPLPVDEAPSGTRRAAVAGTMPGGAC